MKLEDIGFYTLSDKRAKTASWYSPLQRCEILLTSRCNFNCPYCRHVGGEDANIKEVINTINLFSLHNAENIRFSGGEPTLYKDLNLLVALSKTLGIKRIAVSSNGSAKKEVYEELIKSGVNDFSISLDACCAEDNKKMTGGRDVFDIVSDNIKFISSEVYTTVGVVFTEDNINRFKDIVSYADSLGVHDIRIIPAAQNGNTLKSIDIPTTIKEKYKILNYRLNNIQKGRPVRGIGEADCDRCGLVLDDVAVCENKHYPCIIYLREGGSPIGNMHLRSYNTIGDIRFDRAEWCRNHNTKNDPICSKNCLDVCVDYNNKFYEYRK